MGQYFSGKSSMSISSEKKRVTEREEERSTFHDDARIWDGSFDAACKLLT